MSKLHFRRKCWTGWCGRFVRKDSLVDDWEKVSCDVCWRVLGGVKVKNPKVHFDLFGGISACKRSGVCLVVDWEQVSCVHCLRFRGGGW